MLNMTQIALLKAMEARLFDPVKVTERDDHVTISGYRDDWRELPESTLVGITARWGATANDNFVIAARRGSRPEVVGYREVIAELKTGRRAETGEQNVRQILGGVFLDQNPATKAEQAVERAFNAAVAAVAKAVKAAGLAERKAAREAKAAAKADRPGIGEDVSEE